MRAKLRSISLLAAFGASAASTWNQTSENPTLTARPSQACGYQLKRLTSGYIQRNGPISSIATQNLKDGSRPIIMSMVDKGMSCINIHEAAPINHEECHLKSKESGSSRHAHSTACYRTHFLYALKTMQNSVRSELESNLHTNRQQHPGLSRRCR